MKPLPSALYNLSQSYRVTLNFDKGEEYFLAAQRLDNDAVLNFRRIAGRNPNRFVVDEGLPVSDLLKYAMGKITWRVDVGPVNRPADGYARYSTAYGDTLFYYEQVF